MRKLKKNEAVLPHALRQQYADLVGAESIDITQKKDFVLWDVLAYGLIILFFCWVAWSTGYVAPRQKVANLQAQIDRIMGHFDDRTKQTINLVDSLKTRIEENKLGQLEDSITKIHDEVIRLSFDKPNDDAIKDRFDAALEFARLSQDIVDNRDLSQYYLNFGQTNDADSQEADKEDQAPENDSGWFSFLGRDIKDPMGHIDISEINIGGETDRIIGQGKSTILAAESFLDELTPSEIKGKALLAKFSGFAMPRRKHELLGLTLAEWKSKHTELLEQWKALREIDLVVANIERKREEQMRKLELEKLERERLESEAKAKEVTAPTVVTPTPPENQDVPDTITPAPKPKVNPPTPVPAPKTQKALLEEKKRKAKQLLD